MAFANDSKRDARFLNSTTSGRKRNRQHLPRAKKCFCSRLSWLLITSSLLVGWRLVAWHHLVGDDTLSFSVIKSESFGSLLDLPLACVGKERLVKIIQSAHLQMESHESTLSTNWTAMCETLPTWDEVRGLYGDEPIVVGLETCPSGKSRQWHPRVAGLFHTGTNVLARLLYHNHWEGETEGKNGTKTQQIATGMDGEEHRMYDVPWGKHADIATALDVTVYPSNEDTISAKVLPIVLVRDPLRWMQKMCKVPYDAVWERRRQRYLCPNLVRDSLDPIDHLHGNQSTMTYPVSVNSYGNITDIYASLADMWSSWNRHYFYNYTTIANGPRLMIRMEDVVFHSEKILKSIDKCLYGGAVQYRPRYSYLLAKAKDHGYSSDLIRAIQTYGTRQGRHKGLTRADKIYANHALDDGLMRIFRYPSIPVWNTSS